MNVLTSEGDTSITLKAKTKDPESKESEFRISFDVQSAGEVAPWS
jgi:hypothetical protein